MCSNQERSRGVGTDCRCNCNFNKKRAGNPVEGQALAKQCDLRNEDCTGQGAANERGPASFCQKPAQSARPPTVYAFSFPVLLVITAVPAIQFVASCRALHWPATSRRARVPLSRAPARISTERLLALSVPSPRERVALSPWLRQRSRIRRRGIRPPTLARST